MRVYLILVGALGTVSWLSQGVKGRGNPYVVVFATIQLVVFLGWLCLGVFLRRLLTFSPRRVLQFLLASSAWFLLVVVATLLGGFGVEANLLIGALVALYLWWNARRLATELRNSTTPTDSATQN
jgi:hypothetical protein